MVAIKCHFAFSRDGKALERFLQDYFDGNLKKYLKSEPVPENNDGPVKVSVVPREAKAAASDEKHLSSSFQLYASIPCCMCTAVAP